MTTFIVYRAVKEGASIDDQPEWWVVDSREKEKREDSFVCRRCATKPEADRVAKELNQQHESS